MTTKAATTPSVTTKAATTPSITTKAATSPSMSTKPATSASVTTKAAMTQDMTTKAATTPSVTTKAATTPSVTTKAATTPIVTTKAATTQSVTTKAATTPSVTTKAVTTPSVTTKAATTLGMTSKAATIPSVTTKAATTPSMSTKRATSASVTTKAATIPGMTTKAATSPRMSTKPAATAGDTTKSHTTAAAISSVLISDSATTDTGFIPTTIDGVTTMTTTAATTTPPEPIFIIVFIRDGVTDEPVQGAEVILLIDKEISSIRSTNVNGMTVLQVKGSVTQAFIISASSDGYMDNSILVTKYDSTVTLKLLQVQAAQLEVMQNAVFVTAEKTVDGQSAVVVFDTSLVPPYVTDPSQMTASVTMAESADYVPALALRSPTSGNPIPLNVTFHGAMEVSIMDNSSSRKVPISGSVEMYLPLARTVEIIDREKVSAWYYDEEEAIWVKSGYGRVFEYEGSLTWYYEAPHLSWWMAADEKVTESVSERITMEELSFDVLIIIAIVAGALVLCVFSLVVYRLCCPCARKKRKRRPELFDRRNSDLILNMPDTYVNHGVYHADMSVDSKSPRSYDVQNDQNLNTSSSGQNNIGQNSPVVMVSKTNQSAKPKAELYYSRDENTEQSEEEGWIL
ncbi:mucin-22-like [Ptychodera flava]|uniref:mucin-22-like n=1 Tax=Ptychodera flava TaxID=63121 RepID=UPI003969CB17